MSEVTSNDSNLLSVPSFDFGLRTMSGILSSNASNSGSLPSFDLGLRRMSEILTDEKQEDIKEERSLNAISRYVGVSNYFSSSLKQQVQTSKYGIIPNIMFLCMQQILKRGLKEEGIFRKSGNYIKVQETRKQLEAGKKVYFDILDIRTIASIFKL